MSLIIAFANNKGGTGKTTCVVQTAAALARAGKSVLVADLDPQGNATQSFGLDPESLQSIPTVSEAIKANTHGERGGEGAAADVVVSCEWRDSRGALTEEAKLIHVLPARFDLENRESESGTPGAVRRFAKALAGVAENYDYVLVDTRPSLGHLSQLAYAAADYVVLVTTPTYFAAEGAGRVVDFISTSAVDLNNSKLKLGGVVINKVKQTTADRAQIDGIVETYGDKVWRLRTIKGKLGDYEVENTPDFIPDWTRFAEAENANSSLSAWSGDRARKTTAIFDQIAANIIALAA
jgi:chromosome partitioning protein